MTTKRGTGVLRSLEMPRTAGNQQKLEEARKDPLRGSMIQESPWFQASRLQNTERINFYCFKLPSLGYFVLAALEKEYNLFNLPSRVTTHLDLYLMSWPNYHRCPFPFSKVFPTGWQITVIPLIRYVTIALSSLKPSLLKKCILLRNSLSFVPAVKTN